MRQCKLLTRALLPGTLVLSSGLFAADTRLLNLVMPDARIMAGANVTTAKISPFGQFLLSRVGANNPGLQDLIAATGFDPRQDVTEILAASTGNPAAPGGLVLARGTFDVAKLVAAIPPGGKQQVQTYAGATLIAGPDAKGTHAVAFPDGTIAIAGDLVSVKAALDRAAGVNSISPELAVRVQALSTTQDVWTVSLASLASLIPDGVAPNDLPVSQTLAIVKNIQASSGGVKFGSAVLFTGQAVANTAPDATAIADVVKLLASLAAMTAGQDPHAAAAAQLVKALQVSTDGLAVNVAATVPEDQLESLIATVGAPRPASAGPHRRGAKL